MPKHSRYQMFSPSVLLSWEHFTSLLISHITHRYSEMKGLILLDNRGHPKEETDTTKRESVGLLSWKGKLL